MKIRNKENVVCFSERLGTHAKRRQSDGTQLKNFPRRNLRLLYVKVLSRAITKVCFYSYGQSPLFGISIYLMVEEHTQLRCQQLEAGEADKKTFPFIGVGGGVAMEKISYFV